MASGVLASLSLKRDIMLEYKQTNDENIFNKLVNDRDIKRLFFTIARRKLYYRPTTLYDAEDLVAIGYLVMWQSIKDYVFICPVCKLKALSQKSHEKHMLRKHKKILLPKPTIEQHVLYNISTYMQNAIRDEYNIKRAANRSFSQVKLFSPGAYYEDATKSESDIDNLGLEDLYDPDDIENKTIFNLFIEQALGAENEVSRYIFKSYFIDKMKGVDIARKLHELGYYSSVQSASVMVSRKIDKMLKKFAELYSTIDKN